MVRFVPPRLARWMTIALQARAPPEGVSPAAPAAPQGLAPAWRHAALGAARVDADVEAPPEPPQDGAEVVAEAVITQGAEDEETNADAVAKAAAQPTSAAGQEEVEEDDALGEGDMVMARPVVGRPLLGGLEERAAIALLRGAIRDRARVSDAEAGRMADARWRQLSNGNRAALVALMLERRELGQEQYEMAMGQREGELWSPEPLAKPARVERRRPLLGGPEEQLAKVVLRTAFRNIAPQLTDDAAATLVKAEWKRFPNGAKAAFVLKTLPNVASDLDQDAWSELSDSEKEMLAKRILEENEPASKAAELVMNEMRLAVAQETPMRRPAALPLSTSPKRPVLGGPEEQMAMAVLRSAIRNSDPQVTDTEAAKLAQKQWQRLGNGAKAAFVLKTLPNIAYDLDREAWSELPETEKDMLAGLVLEENEGASAAAELLLSDMRAVAEEEAEAEEAELSESEEDALARRILEENEQASVPAEFVVEEVAAVEDARPPIAKSSTRRPAPIGPEEQTESAALRSALRDGAQRTEDGAAELAEDSSAAVVPTAQQAVRQEKTSAGADGAETAGRAARSAAPVHRPPVATTQVAGEGREDGAGPREQPSGESGATPAHRAPRPRSGQVYRQGEAKLGFGSDVEKAAYLLLKESVAASEPTLSAEELAAEAAARWRQLTEGVRASFLRRARATLPQAAAPAAPPASQATGAATRAAKVNQARAAAARRARGAQASETPTPRMAAATDAAAAVGAAPDARASQAGGTAASAAAISRARAAVAASTAARASNAAASPRTAAATEAAINRARAAVAAKRAASTGVVAATPDRKRTAAAMPATPPTAAGLQKSPTTAASAPAESLTRDAREPLSRPAAANEDATTAPPATQAPPKRKWSRGAFSTYRG